MAAVRSFRDLKVYKLSVSEAYTLFLLSRSFPKEERYSLTDQVRRASRAVGALIAEAWERRRYPAAFANKINEALSEAMETQSWLDHAVSCAYIGRPDYHSRDAAWQQIGAMLNKLIQRTDAFCNAASES